MESKLPALVNDLVPIEVSLDNLFLDPNNPRFVSEDWVWIPDSDVVYEPVQAEARLKLVRSFGADKLRMNMEINGYLPIDRIVVRQLEEDRYVVLEGNRRICAAKLLWEEYESQLDFDIEVKESLRVIPCLQYVGSERDASWIFQGLRHITGVTDWPAYNKAKLLVEQMEEEDLNLTQVGRRFGLTAHGAGQWVRGYRAYKQASENSDFVSEVSEQAYPYFQELFSRSSAPVREWLEWNERDQRFDDALSFNEFVSWLYARPSEENEEDSYADVFGEWERRALRRRDDIRQVAFLIRQDKEAFEQFRRDMDIERAYSIAVSRGYEQEARDRVDRSKEVFESVASCTNVLENVPFKLLKDDDSRTRLFEMLETLEKVIASIKE